VEVREITEERDDDGWVLIRQSRSHKDFRHPDRSGTITVPGNFGDDLARGSIGSIVKRVRLSRMQQ
jgi:predicted RNA binding protein YcfA (HicA-like mRNA interferase family)